MRQLLYVSNTTRKLETGELQDILAASRRNNAPLGVTGMLLYIDGGFLQVLEGEERTLRQVYDRICADPRHWNARVLLDHDSPRAFADWSMGFERLDAGDAGTAGLFAITRDAIDDKLVPHAGRVVALMLETFYKVQTGAAMRTAKKAG